MSQGEVEQVHAILKRVALENDVVPREYTLARTLSMQANGSIKELFNHQFRITSTVFAILGFVTKLKFYQSVSYKMRALHLFSMVFQWPRLTFSIKVILNLRRNVLFEILDEYLLTVITSNNILQCHVALFSFSHS